MYSKKNRLFSLLMFSVVLLTSCLSGIEPLPDKIGDLDLSLSIPIANAEVVRTDTKPIGAPNGLVNIPEWARYDTIFFTDTVAVDLYRIYENSDDIKYLAFTTNIWNEFPVKGLLNMYFTDKSYNILFSFDAVNVNKGDVLFNGNIVAPGYSNSKVGFDKPLIESLKTAEFLVINLKIILKDERTTYFPFFDEFKMNCHLGARVDFILKDN